MKKTVLILAGFLVAQAGFSQLTQSNEAAIGASESLFLCDSMAPNLEAVTGASAVWNYEFLAAYPSQMRTISMLDGTTAPNASSFPGATKAFSIEGLITTFFSSTSSERTSQGFVFTEVTAGEILATFEDNAAILMTYPFALSSSSIDAYAGSVETSGLPGAFPATGSVTSTIDGTGTINFPLGFSVPNVTRLKTIDNAVATVPFLGNVTINRKQFEYYDLATSSMPILMHITIDLVIPGGAPMSTSFVLSKFSGIYNVGIENNESIAFTIFPNPSNDFVTFKGELNNANVIVLNTLGQEVLSQTISTGDSMNVSSLNAGIYLVKVESNGVSAVRRLSIN